MSSQELPLHHMVVENVATTSDNDADDDNDNDDKCISASFVHTINVCDVDQLTKRLRSTPRQEKRTVTLRTQRRPRKLGVMVVGLGGNNGSTLVASILANKRALTWETKEGMQAANFFGSLTQAGTVRIGETPRGDAVHMRVCDILPMVDPTEIKIGGWDISGANIYEAVKRARVLPVPLREQLADDLRKITPLPAFYLPGSIASNQKERADNILHITPDMTYEYAVARLAADIAEFKVSSGVDTVIVIWTASTERTTNALAGHGVLESRKAFVDHLDSPINQDASSPLLASHIYATAATRAGAHFFNGSPQNTVAPALQEIAKKAGVFIGGSDFKSGQTKIKSVLVDYLVGAGVRPDAISSYNHLGNNDGRNLDEAPQFESKRVSKTTVVDDVVQSNTVLYPRDGSANPDHTVVIKYVPSVGDSKRALDEYSSSIFMGGKNTMSLYNVCEDSLLATPLIIDIVLLVELFSRVAFSDERAGAPKYHPLANIDSLMSYFFKAPCAPSGALVTNALMTQRRALVNFLMLCAGLAPSDDIDLKHICPLDQQK